MALDEGEPSATVTAGQGAAGLVLVFAPSPIRCHIQPSSGVAGAGMLIVVSGLTRSESPSSVEWDTLFAGLFMRPALVKTGVVDLARAATQLTGGQYGPLRLNPGASPPRSGIIDNIP